MPLSHSSQLVLEQIQSATINKRIVFVSGNFNILHPGHLRLLRFARECGDFLLVGMLNAASPGAYIEEPLRLEGLRSIQWVDHAFILHDPPDAFIAELRPAFVVKGNEHETKSNSESEAVASYGGKLLFCSGDITFSSVDLLRKEFRELNISTIKKPVEFTKRHKIESADALLTLKKMKSLRLIVIGDTIVDEYITCDPIGMSQEDPTIVVTPVMHEKFIGGAAIVAAHARSLGSHVDFFSVIGCDDTAKFATSAINDKAVEFYCYSDESRPTTLKQRFRASNKTLLRVSHLRQHDITVEIRERISSDIKEALKQADLLIFSDFNYGCLPQSLVMDIITEARQQGVLMAADSQSSSQLGDVSRYYNMALITPTEREARLAMQDFDSGLVVLAEHLKEKTASDHVVITLGAEGMLVQTRATETNRWPTDRLPALNVAPKDVAGAGDSFLTCAAMALAAGADIWMASYLGSLAAACQVGRIGNMPLTHDELIVEIMA